MKKYFKVTGSKIAEDYFVYVDNGKKVNKAYKEFKSAWGIESKQYAPGMTYLYIVPTSNDLIKFEKELTKEDYDGGLRRFRKNSKTVKAWNKKLKESGIEKNISKPDIGFDYGPACIGRYRTRLFNSGKDVYASISTDEYNLNDFKMPEGTIEIKASDFFKIIEHEQEKMKINS